MNDAFARLPPLGPRVELTVAIPARNEESSIGATLTALARQCERDGTAVAYTRYETIVFANDCDDATVARARNVASAHPGFTLYVVAGVLPRAVAHVGTARKDVMDAAAQRFLRAGRPRGTIATTDADTIVDAHWVAETLAERRHADAVMGRIMLAPEERDRLSRGARRLYLGTWRIGESSASSKRCAIPWPAIPYRGTVSITVRALRYPPSRTNAQAESRRDRCSKISRSSKRLGVSMHAYATVCACASRRQPGRSRASKAASQRF